jgi:hypothetical protein
MGKFYTQQNVSVHLFKLYTIKFDRYISEQVDTRTQFFREQYVIIINIVRNAY